jgi:predicted nucleic acid-binding Zn ribbon protein
MAKKTKSKTCPVCGNSFTPFYNSLQPVCSPKCALTFNSEKEVKKRFDKLKIEVEGTGQLEKAARIIFQQWVRERDKHHPCVSCGAVHTKMDAGHYFKAELYSGLIFEEFNCHKQCCYCNGPHMHANLVEYRKGLIARYGEDAVLELEAIADANRTYKWSRSELIDIANTYKRKLKLLQANTSA